MLADRAIESADPSKIIKKEADETEKGIFKVYIESQLNVLLKIL